MKIFLGMSHICITLCDHLVIFYGNNLFPLIAFYVVHVVLILIVLRHAPCFFEQICILYVYLNCYTLNWRKEPIA